jgi:hypothetical protein
MMLMIFLVLTCTISLTLHKVMNMTIHNRHSGIELVSLAYFCAGGTYYEYPAGKTNIGVMMIFDFRFDPDQDTSGGILIYEIRRKGNEISDLQSNVDPIYTKAIEEASKMMRLLVIWKTKHLEEPKANAILVEYDNRLVLDEDKLAQLYGNVNDIPYDRHRCTWSIYSNTALVIRCKVAWKESLRLDVDISYKERDSNAIRPMWIDSERQVPSLII